MSYLCKTLLLALGLLLVAPAPAVHAQGRSAPGVDVVPKLPMALDVPQAFLPKMRQVVASTPLPANEANATVTAWSVDQLRARRREEEALLLMLMDA